MIEVSAIKELYLREKLANNDSRSLSDEEVLIWLLMDIKTSASEAYRIADSLIKKHKTLQKILSLEEKDLLEIADMRSNNIFVLRNFLRFMDAYRKLATRYKDKNNLYNVGRLSIKSAEFEKFVINDSRKGTFVLLLKSDAKRGLVYNIGGASVDEIMADESFVSKLKSTKSPSAIVVICVRCEDNSLSEDEKLRLQQLNNQLKRFKSRCYDYIYMDKGTKYSLRSVASADFKGEVVSNFYTKSINKSKKSAIAIEDKLLNMPDELSAIEVLSLMVKYRVPENTDVSALACNIIEACGFLKNVCCGTIENSKTDENFSTYLSNYFAECGAIYNRIKSGKDRHIEICSLAAAVSFYSAHVGFEGVEKSYLLCFNSNGDNPQSMPFSVGEQSSVVVNPDAVINMMCRNESKHLVLVHSHPFSDVAPSCNDIAFTHYLIKELDFVGYQLIDHLIVSSDNYISLRAMGVINTPCNKIILQKWFDK
ncbi:MAG: JAB domain-containing protein [Bacillota bacterium]